MYEGNQLTITSVTPECSPGFSVTFNAKLWVNRYKQISFAKRLMKRNVFYFYNQIHLHKASIK